MKRIRIYSFLIFSAFCLMAAYSCEVDCGCEPEPQSMDTCQCFDNSRDVLMVADFEDEGLPNDCGGSIGIWKDTLSNIEVWATADTMGGGAQNSRWYAKLAIVGNDGVSPVGWTGGGLVIKLTDCPEGVDLSRYDSLQFEVKMFANSNLRETRIKLQDIENDSIPERYILNSDYGNFPSADWETISIPLEHFDTILITDHLYKWVPLDQERVKEIVSVSVNDGSFVEPANGILGFDNFRFVKK